ncbi:MAG: cytochrome c family protein [bacterium]
MNRKIGIIILAFVFIGTLSILPLLSAEEAAKPTYVGNSKCKMCHKGEAKGLVWENWLETKHAKSMESLNAEKGETKDPKCLKCHVTGFGAATGYNADTPNEELATVGCEACHGPGSNYKTLTIMKDREKAVAAGLILPDEKACKTCHNEESPTYKGFDYAKALPMGTHVKAAAAADTTKPAEQPVEEEKPK